MSYDSFLEKRGLGQYLGGLGYEHAIKSGQISTKYIVAGRKIAAQQDAHSIWLSEIH